MSKCDGSNFIFYVEVGTQKKWLKRAELEPMYLKELCAFYESKIVFKN
jgi:hypothetical protein